MCSRGEGEGKKKWVTGPVTVCCPSAYPRAMLKEPKLRALEQAQGVLMPKQYQKTLTPVIV